MNDILDIENIAAGKMAFSFEVVEMNRLVRAVVEQNQSYADKFNVSFTAHAEREVAVEREKALADE